MIFDLVVLKGGQVWVIPIERMLRRAGLPVLTYI